MDLSSSLPGLVAELVVEHDVPGAAVALAVGDEVVTASTGIANTATGVEVTSDTLFQIGSVAKTMTATALLTLVEEGAVELDTRLVDVVPGFAVADADVTQQVTMRHLLTHTSGLDGDHLVDTGWGDDALERYTASCRELASSTPLGATWSYANSGYALLGRAVEVLTGTTWDEAVRARVLGPLELSESASVPHELLRHRVAFGHAGRTALPVWSMGRSWGPAGSTMCCSASDLLRYGREATREGGLLAAPTLEQALAPAVPAPGMPGVEGWGLGWASYAWEGARVVGHDGATMGQTALLRVLPDRDAALAVCVNGRAGAQAVVDGVVRQVAEQLGVIPPPPLLPRDGAVEVAPGDDRLGSYERSGFRLHLTEQGGRLAARAEVSGVMAAALGSSEMPVELRPGPDDTVLASLPGVEQWLPLPFYTGTDGRQYASLVSALRKV